MSNTKTASREPECCTFGEMSGPPEAQDERALKLSMGVYLSVMALKLLAWWWTGVMALLAEGLHTLSDVFVAGFLWVAVRWSRRQPDEVHMYGYGRAQYVGALVAAVLFVSFTAFELFREGLSSLLGHHPPVMMRDVPIALGVLIVSMLVGAWPLVRLVRQKERGAAAKAQLLELVNDQLGLVAALVGSALVLAGFPLADPLASLIVATIILVNGVGLFRENLSYVLGRAPPREEMARIESLVLAVKGVLGVHRLKAQQLSPQSLYVEMHIEVGRGLPIEDANDIAEEVTRAVEGFTRGPNFVSVHVDPEQLSESRERAVGV